MKTIRKSLFVRIVAICVMAIFLTAANVSPVVAKSENGIKVRHKAIRYFVPEKRIRLEARIIKDNSEIKLVRCYFRAVGLADYVFVGMEAGEKGAYTAILPAPSSETLTLEYLFLVVDQNNKPIKTQVYTMNKKESDTVPSWQQVNSEGTIQVSTEIGEAQASVPGFSDSITMNVVESSARFGIVVGGIYQLRGEDSSTDIPDRQDNPNKFDKPDKPNTPELETSPDTTASVGTDSAQTTSVSNSTASTGSAAAETSAATTAGTAATTTAATATVTTTSIAAAGAGLSTGAMIGIGVGAAALVGGGVAVAGGGGGDDAPQIDTVSTWEFHSKCANSSAESPVVFNIQLNETKGNGFDGSGTGQRNDYADGMQVTMSMTGNYDAKTRALSGGITTTTSQLPFSCVRHDNFSFAIPSGSNDTGYQTAVEQGSSGCGNETGCVMQVRFVRK